MNDLARTAKIANAFKKKKVAPLCKNNLSHPGGRFRNFKNKIFFTHWVRQGLTFSLKVVFFERLTITTRVVLVLLIFLHFRFDQQWKT